MFGRRKRARDPITMKRFLCVLLPKIMIGISAVIYLVAGVALFMTDEERWEHIMRPWGVIEVIICVALAAWIGIGSAYLRYSEAHSDERDQFK